jgi:hypothetical protein
MVGPARALPGQSQEETKAWILANPTLNPQADGSLLVRQSDTPARRFTFQASAFRVGLLTPVPMGGIVRTEEITFFDMVNGVNRFRLEESLRAIYGAALYQDYVQGRRVYAYPNANNRPNTKIGKALQGDVREGDRYAYWVEIVNRADGYPYMGKLVVFLKEDLPKLLAELQNR